MGFVPFTFVDLIDIILVAVIMYWIYRMTKGTNAPYILSGIIAVYLLWVVVRALNMELLSTILGQLISVGAIALIIVFQPELRRFLQMIGMRQKHFNFITRIFSTGEDTVQTNVVPIVTACREMSETKTGALIVIGQQSDLRLIAEGGIALDAKVSTSLIKNIFFKNAPLHDGAALIEGDRIVAAKCILPVTQSDVPKSFGTRHRAAIGMSEISDAIIVVVSEETGDISIAQGGEIRLNIDPVRLQQTLQRYLTINTRKRHAQTLEKGGRRISGAGFRGGRRFPDRPFRSALPRHSPNTQNKQVCFTRPERPASHCAHGGRKTSRLSPP